MYHCSLASQTLRFPQRRRSLPVCGAGKGSEGTGLVPFVLGASLRHHCGVRGHMGEGTGIGRVGGTSVVPRHPRARVSGNETREEHDVGELQSS